MCVLDRGMVWNKCRYWVEVDYRGLVYEVKY